MQINPLIAGTFASILVLSVVGFKTINDTQALHPEQVSVAKAATAKPILKPCAECGVIVAIKQVEVKGEGTGVGAVVGGLVGAVFGHEVAKDKDVGTVVGAAGGAVAGHQIERHARSSKRYEIQVRMSDGSVRTLSSSTQPIWKAGDRVRLQNGKLIG